VKERVLKSTLINDGCISLILATLNRRIEVEKFLLSVLKQDYDLSKIEVVILDQNSSTLITDIIQAYSPLLRIRYKRLNNGGRKSIALNCGMALASHSLLAYPDDDCEYYPDTIRTAIDCFECNRDVDVFIGRVVNNATQCDVIRNWRKTDTWINKWNFFRNYSMIAIFARKHSLEFDEEMGPGTKYKAYEDADWIYRALYCNTKILFTPRIRVSHPDLNIRTMNPKKNYNYGLGFGAFVRKNLSIYLMMLFSAAIVYQTAGLLSALCRLKRNEVRHWYIAISSRLRGFIEYV
jgi:glycosyltransferase involved in cell wall biosynthesis